MCRAATIRRGEPFSRGLGRAPARLLHVLPEDVPARVPGLDGERPRDVHPAGQDGPAQPAAARAAARGPPSRPIRCGRAPAAATARCTAITATSPASCCSPVAPPPSSTACRIPRSPATASASARASSGCRAQLATDVPRPARDRGRHRLLARLRRDRQGRRRHRRRARAVRARRPRDVEDRRGAAGVRRLSAARRRPPRSVPLARRPRRRVAARLPQGRDQLLGVPLRDARAVRGRGRQRCAPRSSRSPTCSRPPRSNLACSLNRKTVYYHDPCYHARYNDVVEQPRRALAQLAEVRELRWNKTDTECCGGGGLLPKTMPAIADQMAKRRLAEVQATGGGMVVTSCATCTFMLKRNAPPSVEVANLATAMAQLSETPFTAPPSSPARRRRLAARGRSRDRRRSTRKHAGSRTHRVRTSAPRAGSASRSNLRSANDSTICLHGVGDARELDDRPRRRARAASPPRARSSRAR